MGEKEPKDRGVGEQADRRFTPPFTAWISIVAAEPKSSIAKAGGDGVGWAGEDG
jgi:hypothetical protein